jgi:hypothetical protein
MVVEPSVVVDGLLDPTSVGDHARAAMGQSGVYVPHLLYPKGTNALRKEEVRQQRWMEQEFESLLRLPWDRVPFGSFGRLT